MHAIRIAILLVATALIAGCAPAVGQTVTLDGVEVRVIVADDAAEQSRGLQGVDALADGEGMLFVFSDAAPRTFGMKDVTFPIDVVFIAEDGTVSAIEPLDPGDTRPVTSPGPSPYVVELPKGWAEEHGIDVGDAFEISGEAR